MDRAASLRRRVHRQWVIALVWMTVGLWCGLCEARAQRGSSDERFGDAAVDAVVVEAGLEQVARRMITPSARREWEAAVERIAQLSPQGRGEVERKKLASAWSRVAELLRRLDGPTPQYLDSLEVAFALDPENEALRREVEYQRHRKSLLEARVAEAARVRGAREAGQDPYANLPYIGGPNQAPVMETRR